MRPSLLGYLSTGLWTPDDAVDRLRLGLADYAGREGFTLRHAYVERAHVGAPEFNALIAALKRTDVNAVVVPALHHFAHSPGIRLAMKEHLERETGAQVLVMFPSLDESP